MKALFNNQLTNFICIWKDVLGSLDARSIGTKASIQSLGERVSRRSPLDGAVDAQSWSASAGQNASHLSKCQRAVWEELKTQLAKDKIERVVREWELQCATFAPFNPRGSNRSQ